MISVLSVLEHVAQVGAASGALDLGPDHAVAGVDDLADVTDFAIEDLNRLDVATHFGTHFRRVKGLVRHFNGVGLDPRLFRLRPRAMRISRPDKQQQRLVGVRPRRHPFLDVIDVQPATLCGTWDDRYLTRFRPRPVPDLTVPGDLIAFRRHQRQQRFHAWLAHLFMIADDAVVVRHQAGKQRRTAGRTRR